MAGRTLADLQAEVREVNEANGWFEGERAFADDIALLHSEVTEAYEEWRNGHRPDEIYFNVEGGVRLQKPEGVPIELADLAIRLLDTCERLDIDLAQCIEIKLAYNRTRGHRHGGKRV